MNFVFAVGLGLSVHSELALALERGHEREAQQQRAVRRDRLARVPVTDTADYT